MTIHKKPYWEPNVVKTVLFSGFGMSLYASETEVESEFNLNCLQNKE